MNAHLWLLIAALAWGSEFPLMRYATREVGVAATGAATAVLTTLCLGLVLAIGRRRRGLPRAGERRPTPWRSLIVIGGVGACFNALLLMAIKLTSAVNVATLSRTDVLFSLAIAAIVLHERITAVVFPLVIVMLVGVCLVTGFAQGDARLGRAGDLLALGGALLMSINALMIKPAVGRVGGVLVALVNTGINTLCFGVFWVGARAWSPVAGYSVPVLGVLAALGCLSALFLVSYYTALRTVQPWEAFMVFLAVPAVAALGAMAAFHETPTGWQWMGMVLVCGGAAGLIWLRRPSASSIEIGRAHPPLKEKAQS
jgi:drug/metabolite transporter (DMT)-like permease